MAFKILSQEEIAILNKREKEAYEQEYQELSLIHISSKKVYNFKVDDYHTYFVGRTMILVHNAKYDVGKYNEMPNEPGMDKHHVPQKAVMKKLDPNYDPATGPSIQVPKDCLLYTSL